MADEQSIQVQFEIRLVPEGQEADVQGYVGAGQVNIGNQPYRVFVGNFGFRPGGAQGIATQGIAAQGIAAQGIAAQGIASQGIASQGIASRR